MGADAVARASECGVGCAEAAHAFRRCSLFPTDLDALRKLQTHLEADLAPERQRFLEDLIRQGGQEEKSR
jgi:hypothetical protein